MGDGAYSKIDDNYIEVVDDAYIEVVDDTYNELNGADEPHTYDKIAISNRNRNNRPSQPNVDTASEYPIYINRLKSK